MESALGSISGVKNVYSMSYENYGIVELEFADGTDMDSAMVKVSSCSGQCKIDIAGGMRFSEYHGDQHGYDGFRISGDIL